MASRRFLSLGFWRWLVVWRLVAGPFGIGVNLLVAFAILSGTPHAFEAIVPTEIGVEAESLTVGLLLGRVVLVSAGFFQALILGLGTPRIDIAIWIERANFTILALLVAHALLVQFPSPDGMSLSQVAGPVVSCLFMLDLQKQERRWSKGRG